MKSSFASVYRVALFLPLFVSELGCQQQAATTADSISTQPVPVQVVSVEQTALRRTTTQPATLLPFYHATIQAKVSGYVSQLNVDIGDVVRQGDVLAVLDIPEMEMQRGVLEAKVIRLEAEEKRAAANIKLADAQFQSAQARLEQTRSELASADASLVASQSQLERTQDLVQRQSLQSRVLDEARMERDAAKAKKDSVASAIISAEADVKVAEANTLAAKAHLETAQAETLIATRELGELDAMLDYRELRAPFDGIVTERLIEPGNLVHAERGGSLFTISQTDRLRVRASIPEVDAALLNPGDTVSIEFPFFSAEAAIEGVVSRVSGMLDASTRSMIAEIELDNPDNKLIPGMFGQVTIELSTQVAANTLPARAIRFSETGDAFVYAINDDETVSKIAIKTGLDTGGEIEVTEGLAPGARVIDAHLKRFSDGQRVAIVP